MLKPSKSTRKTEKSQNLAPTTQQQSTYFMLVFKEIYLFIFKAIWSYPINFIPLGDYYLLRGFGATHNEPTS